MCVELRVFVCNNKPDLTDMLSFRRQSVLLAVSTVNRRRTTTVRVHYLNYYCEGCGGGHLHWGRIPTVWMTVTGCTQGCGLVSAPSYHCAESWITAGVNSPAPLCDVFDYCQRRLSPACFKRRMTRHNMVSLTPPQAVSFVGRFFSLMLHACLVPGLKSVDSVFPES